MRILLVEDDTVLNDVIRRSLEDAGNLVDSAATLAAAVGQGGRARRAWAHANNPVRAAGARAASTCARACGGSLSRDWRSQPRHLAW